MRTFINKSLRFAVLSRDNYTCQYCGKKAPDISLEIDHKLPVSKGGDNRMDNLTTSCFDCNRGKSDKLCVRIDPRKKVSIELDAELVDILNIFVALSGKKTDHFIANCLANEVSGGSARQWYGESLFGSAISVLTDLESEPEE
jgi:hypothetical protein